MSNSSRFFRNTECEYFPCHATDRPEDFNCLFCYCPLYVLGERCGGNYSYTEKGVKNCKDCIFPHERGNYTEITKRFPDISELAKTVRRPNFTVVPNAF